MFTDLYLVIKFIPKMARRSTNDNCLVALCDLKPAERDTVFHIEFSMSLPKEGATPPT